MRQGRHQGALPRIHGTSNCRQARLICHSLCTICRSFCKMQCLKCRLYHSFCEVHCLKVLFDAARMLQQRQASMTMILVKKMSDSFGLLAQHVDPSHEAC